MPKKQKSNQVETAAVMPSPVLRARKARTKAKPVTIVEPQSSAASVDKPILPRRRRFLVLATISIAVVIVIGSLAVAVHFYSKYQEVAKRMTPQGELSALLSALSTVTDLPQGETPTLATVTDKTKLSEQAFFAQAENGDKALIYRDAGRAFLFRPSTGKLVNVTTVTEQALETAAPEQSEASLPSPDQLAASPDTVQELPAADMAAAPDVVPEQVDTAAEKISKAQIVLYNGTAKVGITNDFEKDFLVSSSDVEVVDKSPAVRKDYDRTIIIDLSKRYTGFAEELAADVGTSIEAFPEGEAVPEGADILIIVGKDRI